MNYCSLLLLSVCAAELVVDRGQNVTLPCFYEFFSSGPLTSCWSKGKLPYSGMCGKQTIISSNGSAVTMRVNERYRLLGRLDQGDISLTILNTSVEDTGTYGCRVDIPGWNNDHKISISLKIRQAESASVTASARTHTDYMTTTHYMNLSDHVTRSDNVTSSYHVTSTVRLWTSSSGHKAEVKGSTVLLLSLLFSLFCIIIAVILLVVRKWRVFKKMSENLSSVQFSSTASTLHLQQRAPPEENIYN